MRPIDEDYDEGVADALSNLLNPDGPTQSPTASQSRHDAIALKFHFVNSHSAPVQTAPLKRLLSA
jgi:hypothetical protein